MPSNSSNSAVLAHLDNQVGYLSELSRKTNDAVRRITELNLQYSRELAEDMFKVSRQLLTARGPVQLSTLLMNQMAPAGERMRIYQQQLGAVLSSTQADLARLTQEYLPDIGRSTTALAEAMERRAQEARWALSATSSARLSGDTALQAHGGNGSQRVH